LRNMAVLLLVGSFFAWGEAVAQGSQQPASEPSATALLARAREVMGFAQATNRVLHARAITAAEQNFQSDRMYPPFFSAMSTEEIWFDPAAGLLRIQSQTTYPGTGPLPVSVSVDDGQHAEIIRAEGNVPVARRQALSRALSAWAVIADWSAASDVRHAGTEVYRDYPRVVLVRSTPEGEQRLYLDPKSGFPVKLDSIEPHYLWGQRHVEYVWSTWIMKDGVVLPGSAFRVADGDVELSQTVGDLELIARDRAPGLEALRAPVQAPPDLPLFLQPLPPQTISISPNLYLLANRGYREAVALVHGEVFVLEATQGEARARRDQERVAQLFPGRAKVNVVITDLAWPHVAGVRYWVSQGATIIAHASARAFLQQVVDRHWTLAPDTLELERRKDPDKARLKFASVEQATNAAGGALRLLPIDGIGSEVALMAYFPGEKFLWASDFIQTLDEPSAYANEVLLAAKRNGIVPERVAAEHLPISDWKSVQSAQGKVN
jgi:hypothetical protein